MKSPSTTGFTAFQRGVYTVLNKRANWHLEILRNSIHREGMKGRFIASSPLAAYGRQHQFKALVSRRSNGVRRVERSQFPRVARSPHPPRKNPQRRNVSRKPMPGKDSGVSAASASAAKRLGPDPKRAPAPPLSPSPPGSPRPRHDPSCTRAAGDIARRRSRQTGPSRTTGC